ncbi:uncharacterized protein JCM15063_003964 [Sporobolomyces koalae]|uniref:uncharacterized protein n=1 Tax=Sporobolomyces koalae TaxID=500713 RepID=UPI00317325C5
MLRSRLASLACSASRCSHRRVSTLRVVESTGPRSLALPLCFVSVRGWDASDSAGWHDWIERFSSKGYSSLVLDLDPQAATAQAKTSKSVLSALEQELVSLLRDPATSSPFPPLVFASSTASILAETYVSSHPLSGLVLDQPVPAPLARTRIPRAFPTDVDEFDYEPFFPVAVISRDGQDSLHRLVTDFGGPDEDSLVRTIVAERDEHGWQQIMEWMDEHGL